MNDIKVEVWGDLACFSRPESKVERLTYPVITPSAARGILSAIYSKPVEFYWQVRKIEVLNPIRYITFKRNEVINSKIGRNPKPMLVEDDRTQRQTVALRDVRYRITAEIIPRPDFKGTVNQLYEQAKRRVHSGKCFFQPSLGLREFVCYFDEATDAEPINESMDIGFMLYDVFDLHKYKVTKTAEPFVSVFHAVLENGVITVPDFDSSEVLKPERRETDA
ncbi:MAG: type I-C CRISPR-associated protein Cas5c [Ruminococcus sp.]|nr:type I-C CRISPR-associated protein Cas5c [Ruminococcus sp.]